MASFFFFMMGIFCRPLAQGFCTLHFFAGIQLALGFDVGAARCFGGLSLSEVKFDRTPYKVEYFQDGKRKSIRRVPPPLLHDIDIKDKVTLTRKKNDDWDVGDTVEVVGITSRQPNTLRVQKSDGTYTFLSYDDVYSKKSVQRAQEPKDSQGKTIDTDYLLWP